VPVVLITSLYMYMAVKLFGAHSKTLLHFISTLHASVSLNATCLFFAERCEKDKARVLVHCTSVKNRFEFFLQTMFVIFISFLTWGKLKSKTNDPLI